MGQASAADAYSLGALEPLGNSKPTLQWLWRGLACLWLCCLRVPGDHGPPHASSAVLSFHGASMSHPALYNSR